MPAIPFSLTALAWLYHKEGEIKAGVPAVGTQGRYLSQRWAFFMRADADMFSLSE